MFHKPLGESSEHGPLHQAAHHKVAMSTPVLLSVSCAMSTSCSCLARMSDCSSTNKLHENCLSTWQAMLQSQHMTQSSEASHRSKSCCLSRRAPCCSLSLCFCPCRGIMGADSGAQHQAHCRPLARRCSPPRVSQQHFLHQWPLASVLQFLLPAESRSQLPAC